MEPSNSQPDDLGPAEQRSDEQVPDPNGPPVVAGGVSVGWGTATVLAITAGVFVVPAFLSPAACMGATRSARLEWQRRQQLMTQAEADQSRSDDAEPADRDVDASR